MADLSELIADHAAALAVWDATDDDEWDRVGKEVGARMDAAQQAMLNHRPASVAELRQKAAYMASCRSFTDWEDFDRVKLIEALTPVPDDLSAIETLIVAHKAAWAALDAACEVTDNAFGTPEQAAAEEVQAKASDATADAMDAIIEHPYSSIDELRRGMGYIVKHHRSTGDGNLEDWLTDLACNVAGIEDEAGGRTNG